MPYINGQNLAPAQGLGLATVLKPDYTPLRILQQGDATRARRAAAEAAAKQKQAQEIAKQWTEDRKLGLDTGGLFQEPFNAYTSNAQEVIGKHYADEQAGRITTAERIQNVANYKNEIERERLLGIDKDKLLANYETSQAGKPFRDIQGLHTALGETVLDPATGKRVRATAYDERANLTKLDADPRTYAADPIIGDYYKGLQASTVDEANAGRIGGIHSSSSLAYKGLLPVKRSDGTWDVKRDALGRPVLAITGDELATARASNHNLNMAVGRLRYEYDNQRQQNPALPKKSDLDLFQDASQKYVSFRQADSEGRNALPRASSSKKDKKAPIYGKPTEGDYQVGGEVPVTPDQDQFFDGYSLRTKGGAVAGADGQPGMTQKGFYSQYSVDAPLNPTNNGPKRFNLGTTGTSFTRSFAPDEKGRYGWRTNLDKPIVGELADAIALPVRPDGTPITPKDGAEYQKAVRDPNNHLQSFVQVLTPKDKNFTAKYEIRLRQLTKERDRLIAVGDEEAKRTTDATLADKAREEATGETVIQYVPNTGQDARTLDRLTRDTGSKEVGNYRAHRDGITGHQQRIRASQPASPGGSIYKRPTAPTTNSPAPSRGGSIYKTR